MPTNERKRKLLDLEELRRQIPHVSQSGLSATIKALKRRGLPDLDRRQDFQEARDLWAAGLNTPYGPISTEREVPSTRGGGPITL